MKNKQGIVKLQVKFSYASGIFKTTPYEFKSKDAFTEWLKKAEEDQTIRKVINKQELLENIQ